MRTLTGLLMVLSCSAFTAGCAGKATLADWQTGVERHAAEEANNDPNFARSLPRRGDQRVFSVLGNAYPQKGQDVHGILVGQREIAGRPWSVFLLGVVDRRQVRDIRVAAVSGPEMQWQVSPRAPEALAQYRQARSEPTAAPLPYQGWPAEDDDFRLEVERNTVLVHDQRSGATWNLPLTAERKR